MGARLAAWIDRTSDTDQEPLADRKLRRELANLRSAWRFIRERDRLDDAVRMVTALTDAASVLGLASTSAWSRGELERADHLARTGLTLAGSDSWRCQATLALVALSRGDLTGAIAHGTDAAAHATRPDQSLGVVALAAAYNGDLHTATALHERLAAISPSPTIEGFHRYVAGEIDALAARTDRAPRA